MNAGSCGVVIATIGRADCVLECLNHLSRQLPPDVEIVVVEAAGAVPMEEGKCRAVWANTRVLRSGVRNAALQRNAGTLAAAGEIVLFLDDDCRVQPGWWPAIVAPFEEPEVGAVAGAVWCNPKPTFTSARGGYVNRWGVPVQVTHRGRGHPRCVDWALSTNMGVRKRAMLQVGGMAGVYGIYDEDVDLGLKLRRAGWKIVFQPDAAVYHYYRERAGAPPTKRTAYRAGRNRTILLVRHYGLLSRLMLFLLAFPFVRLAQATAAVVRAAVTAYGHALAYVVGMLAGLVVGRQHPVAADRIDDAGDISPRV